MSHEIINLCESSSEEIDPIIVYSDSEDCDLQLAIQMSLDPQNTAQPELSANSPIASRSNVSLRNSPLQGANICPTPQEQPRKANIYENTINHPKVKKIANTVCFSDLLYKKHVDKPKEKMVSGLFSSFSVDFEWLKVVIPPNTPHTIIKHYQTSSDKPGHFKVHENLTVVHPPLRPGVYGCMHCKIFFILFCKHIRVVISSANLAEVEWTQLSQMIWFEDFPRVQQRVASEFKSQIIQLIDSFGISGQFLNRYDFSGTEARLVSSVPGRHTGEQLNCFGHLRLRNVIRSLKRQYNYADGSTIHYQCSSIGSGRENWTKEFLESTEGKEDNSLPATNKKREKEEKKIHNSIRIVFPSENAVARSYFPEAAGLLHFRKKFYETNEFLKSSVDLWLPSDPTRQILPHSKVMCCSDKGAVNWIYCGSHNFSQAAWGKLEKRAQQLSISNYEVGIILPAPYYPFTTENLPFAIPSTPFKDSLERPYSSY